MENHLSSHQTIVCIGCNVEMPKNSKATHECGEKVKDKDDMEIKTVLSKVADVATFVSDIATTRNISHPKLILGCDACSSGSVPADWYRYQKSGTGTRA